MTETEIRNLLKQNLKNFLKILIIETGSTEQSVPDLYFYSITEHNITGWIELKSFRNKKLNNVYNPITIDYSSGQIILLNQFKKHGLHVFSIVYLDGVFYLFNEFKKHYNNYQEFFNSSIHRSKKLDISFLKFLQGTNNEK